MPHPTGCSACCPPIAGMRTWFAMTSGTTWSSSWAPPTGCWWWTRPASKGSKSVCSGSTAARRGGRSGYFWPTLAPGEEPCSRICLKYGPGSAGRSRSHVSFRTKPAGDARALEAGVPFATGDAVSDRRLRMWLEQKGMSHVLAIKSNEQLCLAGPGPPPSEGPVSCAG